MHLVFDLDKDIVCYKHCKSLEHDLRRSQAFGWCMDEPSVYTTLKKKQTALNLIFSDQFASSGNLLVVEFLHYPKSIVNKLCFQFVIANIVQWFCFSNPYFQRTLNCKVVWLELQLLNCGLKYSFLLAWCGLALIML